MINIIVIQAVIWAASFCFLLHPCLPNFVAKLAVEIECYLGKRVVKKRLLRMLVGQMDLRTCTHPLLQSLGIILSTIRDRNTAMIIKAMSAIIPRIEEINSNFLHPSALLRNRLNSLWAFRY